MWDRGKWFGKGGRGAFRHTTGIGTQGSASGRLHTQGALEFRQAAHVMALWAMLAMEVVQQLIPKECRVDPSGVRWGELVGREGGSWLQRML